MKIVIAEDDNDLNEFLTNIVMSAGHNVFSFLNGSNALEAIYNEDPDLVFLDIEMPDSDGRDICKIIKSDSRTKDIHIVVASGRDSEYDQKLFFELGADDFIGKPYSHLDIKHRLRSAERRLNSSN